MFMIDKRSWLTNIPDWQTFLIDKYSWLTNIRDWWTFVIYVWFFFIQEQLQNDGSNDYLDWRIDFNYFNLVCIIKYLKFKVIKSCFNEWKFLCLSNFNLRFDLIKTSFFKILTYRNVSGGKFYMILKMKSAQSVHFYRFYGHLKFCPKNDLHKFCLLNIAVKPEIMIQMS